MLPILIISEKLLLAVKMQEETLLFERMLMVITIEEFQKQLPSDEAKKVFWINCYNAFFQILAKREQLNRNVIFKTKIITIANLKFSLDDIEHGILRIYRWKYSFGYLPNFFVSKFIASLAVTQLDYRIHFALNCGAKSCPPIAFYTLEKLDKQLNDAMYSFLISETIIDEKSKKISTSKLLHWYRGDFGGTLGIKKILQDVFELKDNNYKLFYTKYSWETHLENF